MKQSPTSTAVDERLQDLLTRTSRTFALAIPLLPPATRRQVTIAYLLFRIADTLEDASVRWSPDRRLDELQRFDRLLAAPEVAAARAAAAGWLADPPSDHAGYNELLGEAAFVVERFLELSPDARVEIAEHTRRTARLMGEYVGRSDADGILRLRSLEDLRRYCYAVAGIVGEMLTELFVLGSSRLEPVADDLRQRAAAFGEGLQLVNILKDSSADAGEGRHFLPAGLDRAEVFALARRDLRVACDYTLAMQRAGGPPGILAFAALPVELAWATLDTVEQKGAGSKIGRLKVFALYHEVQRRIAEGRDVTVPPA